MKLSNAQINDYFTAKKAGNQCPFCDCTHWAIPTDEAPPADGNDPTPQDVFVMVTHLTNLDISDGSKEVREGTASFIPFMCANCGYTRLQSADFIYDWVAAGEGSL